NDGVSLNATDPVAPASGTATAAASGLPELTEPQHTLAPAIEPAAPPPPPAFGQPADPVQSPLIAANEPAATTNPAQSSLFPEQTIR
ncbi:MAG: hypothetical protein ABI854_02100, partial [Betaproteobacteria bacterium]